MVWFWQTRQRSSLESSNTFFSKSGLLETGVAIFAEVSPVVTWALTAVLITKSAKRLERIESCVNFIALIL